MRPCTCIAMQRCPRLKTVILERSIQRKNVPSYFLQYFYSNHYNFIECVKFSMNRKGQPVGVIKFGFGVEISTLCLSESVSYPQISVMKGFVSFSVTNQKADVVEKSPQWDLNSPPIWYRAGTSWYYLGSLLRLR